MQVDGGSSGDTTAPVLTDDKRVEIIVGLNFGITDVRLLEEWLAHTQKAQHFTVKIAKLSPIFHPKVTLIGGGKLDCAIVGSGNLTAGGQSRNVECGAYIAIPKQTSIGWNSGAHR